MLVQPVWVVAFFDLLDDSTQKVDWPSQSVLVVQVLGLGFSVGVRAEHFLGFGMDPSAACPGDGDTDRDAGNFRFFNF